jgi:hypothetical protein
MEDLSIADYATGTAFPVRNVCQNPFCFQDHGHSMLTLKWSYSEPTTVFAFSDGDANTNEAQDFVTSRELLLTGLRSGTGTGFPVIGEGNVMCQVLSDNRALMALAFNGGYLVLIERNALTEWLMGTYAHVPSDQEERVLDLDRVVAQLLYK